MKYRRLGAAGRALVESAGRIVRSDEELMAAYVGGDAGAFRELFQRYAPALQRLMLRELYAREEANDLVQQTFLHVHRARLDFDPAQRVKPWLYTIALNLKREHFRRRRRRPEVLAGDDVHETAVAPAAHEAFEAHRSVAWALAQLPEENRSVIELHWFEGLSFPEAAKCLGIGAVAAKVRAHRGYVKLRKLLGDDFKGPAERNPSPASDI